MEHLLATAWQEVQTKSNPVAKSLFKQPGINVIAFAFKAGMALKEHTAKWPSDLLVLKGAVVYREAERQVELTALEQVDIAPGVLHTVVAQEDSLCLLMQVEARSTGA